MRRFLAFLGLAAALLVGASQCAHAQTAGAAEYLQKHGLGSKPADVLSPASDAKDEWTVFINLSANVMLDNTGLRIAEQLQERGLIDATRGRRIRIIVQVSLNDDASNNSIGSHLAYDDAVHTHQEADLPPWNSDRDATSVVRFEIADGQKRLLAVERSQGLAADLKNLLKSDPTALKSKHLMLINESHGLAIDGFNGDAGPMSIAEFNAAIADGLQGSGRDKLDIIDFVACQMSNTHALLRMGHLSSLIISSEFPEFAYWETSELLQPITVPLKDLILNTAMQPLDVAHAIQRRSREDCISHAGQRRGPGANPWKFTCATDTIGVYDPAALQSVTRALNSLGLSLLRASQDAASRDKVQDLVAALPKVYYTSGVLPTDNYFYDEQHRDLGMFVDVIEDALKAGTIKDTPKHEVAKAVADVQKAIADVMLEHFNSAPLGMGIPDGLKAKYLPTDPVSGLSIVIPSRPSSRIQNYGVGSRMESDLWINSDITELNKHIGMQMLPPDAVRPLIDTLDGKIKEFREAETYLHSPAQRAHIEQFVPKMERFRAWLQTASHLSQVTRVQEYVVERQLFQQQLDAVLHDPSFWDTIGKAHALRQALTMIKPESLPEQADWNLFIGFLLTQ
jgi:hypothetical protein